MAKPTASSGKPHLVQGATRFQLAHEAVGNDQAGNAVSCEGCRAPGGGLLPNRPTEERIPSSESRQPGNRQPSYRVHPGLAPIYFSSPASDPPQLSPSSCLSGFPQHLSSLRR